VRTARSYPVCTIVRVMAWLYRFVIRLCCHIGKGFHGPTLHREGKGSQCSADTGNIWALKRLDGERLPAFNDGARNLWMNAGARKPNALVCMLLSQHFLGRGGRSLRIRQHFGEIGRTQSGDRRLSHAHWQGTFATQCEDRGSIAELYHHSTRMCCCVSGNTPLVV